jgi:hypothetical protein
MSYEEARRNRKGARKQQNLQTMLALLQGLGQGIQTHVRASREEEREKSMADLRLNQQLQLQDREFAHREQLNDEDNRTRLDVARMQNYGEGRSGKITDREAAEAGAAGNDPHGALTEVDRKLEELKGLGFDADPEMVKSLIQQRELIQAAIGRQRIRSERGLLPSQGAMPPQAGGRPSPVQAEQQMTGDQDKVPSVPAQSAMGAPGRPMTPKGGQEEWAARKWQRLPDAYRRFMSKDISGFLELQQLYGGSLMEPSWVSSQMQQEPGMMRKADGMGTTAVPR